jgi:hypothetical protein
MVKMIKKTKTRKNKKKNKTQRGGLTNMNTNTNTNMNTNINNQIINDKPTIKDNLKKFADIWLKAFNYTGLYALDKVENKLEETSKKFGVNPNDSLENQISKIGKNAERFNKVLDTPEGKRALSNLNALFDKITKKVIVPSSQKLSESLIENLQPIMVRGQNAVFALLSASPFGAVVDIPRFFSESLGVVEKSVSLADDVLDISQDAVNEIKNEKSNYDKVVSEFNSLLDNANIKISSGLDNVGNAVNNYGKNLKRMFYTDDELSKLNPDKKNFDTLALQRELNNRGYELPKSIKKESEKDLIRDYYMPNKFDGILGDETKQALLDWQNKNKKMYGGKLLPSLNKL